jgi:hypothetical protein
MLLERRPVRLGRGGRATIARRSSALSPKKPEGHGRLLSSEARPRVNRGEHQGLSIFANTRWTI